jgi:gamma-glutamylcyclotransferase (GGCT)/AIG2-like uncharacterized protein YtfP
MEASTELYFAYGSNMCGRRIRSRIAGARARGRARADGWQLRFDKPGRDGSGKANLVVEPEAHVWGVVYELPGLQGATLDRFEPGYRREPLQVTTDTRTLVAQSYRFSARVDAAPPAPTGEYLAHLLAGADEHGLPTAHVDYIRSFLR